MKTVHQLPELGKQYGNWIVVDNNPFVADKPTSDEKYVAVQCACGACKTVRLSTFEREESLQCHHCRAENVTKVNQSKDVSDLPDYYFHDIQLSAEKRGIEFAVTKQYLWELFHQQQGKCALSGMQLKFYDNANNKIEPTASIDTIDSSKGYIEGNVQWIHKDINKMKNVFGEEVFVNVCKLIAHQYQQTRTEIIVRLNVEGLHCWSTCDIEEVAYLKNPHRHLFGIVATKVVGHADRDIEFIKLSHQIREYLNNKYYCTIVKCLQFGSQSCEMLASELLQTFMLSTCEVNEDGEGGAIVTRGTI